MQLLEGQEEGWQKSVDVNQAPYGKAVIDFARDWAELMEKRVAEGAELEDIAEQTSHEVAGTYGITGFQYGCAVSLLSQAWVHGERLRRWHNLDTQIHDEGEKANETGGVLNPALLSLGPGD